MMSTFSTSAYKLLTDYLLKWFVLIEISTLWEYIYPVMYTPHRNSQKDKAISLNLELPLFIKGFLKIIRILWVL